jgi:zinc and cadmium transporter
MTVFEILILIFSVLGGGSFLFIFGKIEPSKFKPLMSFSGAFVLGIAILHLLPELYKFQGKSAGIWILIGFLLQLVLDQFSSGVEHGHVHSHIHGGKNLSLKIMIGLSIHSLIEGFPLSMYKELGDFNHLYWGIVVHKIPAAIALTSVMFLSGLKKPMILVCLVLFSLMTPMGSLLGKIYVGSELVFHALTGLVVGSFFHISTTILYESEENGHHSFSFKKLVYLILGFVLSFLTFFLE